MANTSRSESTGGGPSPLVDLLVHAADGDTLYRDRYLQRARELLQPVLPEPVYRAALRDRAEAERCLQRARFAAQQQDWAQVRELSSRAAGLQASGTSNATLHAAAASVYEAPVVALDPFSPGMPPLPGSDARKAHADALAALGQLASADGARAAFYAARKAALSALRPGEAAAQAATPAGGGSQRVRFAVERGDADQLRQLAEQMLAERPAAASASGQAAAARVQFRAPATLADALPATAVARAAALGLEAVEARTSPGMAKAVQDFLDQHAWGPSRDDLGPAREGVTQLRALADKEVQTPTEVEAIVDLVSSFATQVFVNSAGLRYVPLPIDREPCLVEGFAEGEEPVTPLLQGLQLSRRRGLPRTEIENALLLHGARIVGDLGLDADEYRLVCVPPDIHLRVGGERGWGESDEWTHFDGYRVLRNGQLLALVGGSGRYGGLADVCGISPSDGRDNVVARFAVVRRARLGARPA